LRATRRFSSCKIGVPRSVHKNINGELLHLYRVVQYHLEEFMSQFQAGAIKSPCVRMA